MRKLPLAVPALALALTALTVQAQPNGTDEKAVRDAIALGALAFADNCRMCHQADGYGEEGLYPSLRQPHLLSDKTLLLQTILHGRLTQDAEPKRLMPAWSFLTDQEIIGIVAFITNSWGNDVLRVTSEEIGRARCSMQRDGKLAGPGAACAGDPDN